MGMDEGPDERDERGSERISQRRKTQCGFPLVKSMLYALHEPRGPDEASLVFAIQYREYELRRLRRASSSTSALPSIYGRHRKTYRLVFLLGVGSR